LGRSPAARLDEAVGPSHAAIDLEGRPAPRSCHCGKGRPATPARQGARSPRSAENQSRRKRIRRRRRRTRRSRRSSSANLEKAWNSKVIDRTGLIFSRFFGFGARAAALMRGGCRSSFASLQLSALASRAFLGPIWSVQRGGYGFLGRVPGESQPRDRPPALIGERIGPSSRTELEGHQGGTRALQSQPRGQPAWPYPVTRAWVGYTNAGKSTPVQPA